MLTIFFSQSVFLKRHHCLLIVFFCKLIVFTYFLLSSSYFLFIDFIYFTFHPNQSKKNVYEMKDKIREYIRNIEILAMQFTTWIPSLFGSFLPIFIPPAHMAVLWYYWQNYARFVDRRFCSCSCWDTVFKGNQYSIFFIYQL